MKALNFNETLDFHKKLVGQKETAFDELNKTKKNEIKKGIRKMVMM